MKRVWYFLALISVFTVVITISDLNKPPNQSLAQVHSLPQEQSLPVIGTVEKLRSILETAESSRISTRQGINYGTGIARDEMTKSAAPSSATSLRPLQILR